MNIFLNILLILFAVIILLFFLIFFLVVKILFDYDTESGEMALYLKVFFIKYKFFPPDTSKSKRKSLKKNRKKGKNKKTTEEKTTGYITDEELRKMEQDAKGASEKEDNKEKVPFSQRITHFTGLVKTVCEKLLILGPAIYSSLKLEIKKLNIVVASKDAASAAIWYGVVCAAIEGLYTVGNQTGEFKIADDVCVDIDYCKEKFSADMKLVLRIRAAKLIVPIFKVLFS